MRRRADGIVLSGQQAGQFTPNALHKVNPETMESRALTKRSGERLKGGYYTQLYDNGVAVLDIHGPIFRHADTMQTSGAMSTEDVYAELKNVAVNRQYVKALAINFDCPGGDVTAGDIVAQFLNDLSKEMRVESYAEGYCASLAYYWASGTSRITQGRFGETGSVGVVLGVPIPAGQTEYGDTVLMDEDGTAIAEIVSSISPLKRANVLTKKGHEYYQERVNAMADMLVADIAKFRGLDASKLPAQYGDGGVYGSKEALDMGLCDEVGSFETVLERLIASDWERGSSTTGASGATGVEADEPVTGPDSPPPDPDPAEAPEREALHDGGKTAMAKGIGEKLKGAAAALISNNGGQKPGAEAGGDAVPVEDVLTALNEQRPALFDEQVEGAMLFAHTVVTDSRVKPAVQHQLAAVMANMRADDLLFGGMVTFLNAKGEEVEGTREQMFEALFDAMPRHTLAEERIESLRRGAVKGQVMKDSVQPEQHTHDPGDVGDDDMTDEEILGSSHQGKRALESRTQPPQRGQQQRNDSGARR